MRKFAEKGNCVWEKLIMQKNREKCGSEAVISPNNQGIDTGVFDFSRKKIVHGKANNSKKKKRHPNNQS